MQPRQIKSPSSNRGYNNQPEQSRWLSDSCPTGDRHSGPSPMAVQVPGRKLPAAPPPLPPPRYLSDAHPDYDERHSWTRETRRSQPEEDRGPAGRRMSFSKRWADEMEGRRLPERPEHRHRDSSITSASWMNRSPTDSERRYQTQSMQDEGYHSMSGPRTFAQPLPGEKQLHHRDQEKSSQAYDKNLLSKIGKPSTTPPRNASIGSLESSPTSVLSFAQRHPSQFRSLSFPNSASSTFSDPPVKQEPSGRYISSPQSRPVSPRSITSASNIKGFSDYRSPTVEHNSRSSTVDSDTFPPYPQRFPPSINVSRQQKSRRSGSGSLLSQFDESAYVTPNEVKRENYDQSIFSEPDSTFRMEEDVRHLHLEDRTPLTSHPDSSFFRTSDPFHPLHSKMSKSGMKRKQPDDEAQLRLMQQAASAQQYADAPQHLTAQAAGQFAQHQGSISSQSSGFRHDSYASSAGPSIGDSSYTSVDQSPGGVSPSSDTQHYHLSAQDPQYTSLQMGAQPTRSGPYPHHQQSPDNRSTPTQKSQDSSRKQSSSTQAPFSCECCLKKPKKFQTLEELNQHQGEKQYGCMYCKNKFKNKNEAERHQNSIHRRTNSWSCAALADDYSTAFFPDNTSPSGTSPVQQQPVSQTPNGVAAYDICGYCGEQFSNEPQPNWDQRHQHLTTQHKFGDCNRSKKFYRADHFRQHLKHSHGGKSGKHTNALEQACLRDEAPQMSSDNSQSSTPSQTAGGAPVAHMGNLASAPALSHHGIGPHELSQAQMQQHLIASSGNMGPPQMVPSFDTSKIDPSIGYMTSTPHHQQHGMHMQSTGNGGYGMPNESS